MSAIAVNGQSEADVREQFEFAVERLKEHPSEVYWMGVQQALGWVLGEYAESPKEDDLPHLS
jgi:hypothetical protein